jgi:hypothetical protein
VNTGEIVSEEYGVRIKFDSSEPVQQSWELQIIKDCSRHRLAMFCGTSRQQKPFYFEFTPYQHVPRVVSFYVTNMPQSVLDACVNRAIERIEDREKKGHDDQARRLAEERKEKNAQLAEHEGERKEEFDAGA